MTRSTPRSGSCRKRRRAELVGAADFGAHLSTSSLLPRVEVGPDDASGVVLWLHGLGADGHDFEPIVPHLRAPWLRFVFPHAPRRPVTINGGMVMPAWYDVRGFGRGGADVEHVRQMRESIEALLAAERAAGTPSERIVLAGFSQGGACALYTGLRYVERLAGILVLSAYELLPETLGDEAASANVETPLLFCHGTEDPLVPVERGRAAYDARIAEGHRARWHEFPIGHEVSLPEIELIGDWLRERLPESTAGG